MTVSTTEALAAEIDQLREQVLDLGQAVTDMTEREARMRQVLKLVFGYAGEPVPAGPQDERPALHVIDGGAR